MVRRRSSSRSLRLRPFLSLRRLRLGAEGDTVRASNGAGRGAHLLRREQARGTKPGRGSGLPRQAWAHLVTSTAPDRSQGVHDR